MQAGRSRGADAGPLASLGLKKEAKWRLVESGI